MATVDGAGKLAPVGRVIIGSNRDSTSRLVMSLKSIAPRWIVLRSQFDPRHSKNNLRAARFRPRAPISDTRYDASIELAAVADVQARRICVSPALSDVLGSFPCNIPAPTSVGSTAIVLTLPIKRCLCRRYE